MTGQKNTSYSYDEANGIAGVTLPDNATISWNGYTWTRPASVLLPGGTKRSYTYDGLMRMKTIEVKDPLETMLMQYGYGFDNMDNIVSKQTERGDYTYWYDDLYRLTNTDDPTVDNETFTYDNVGNRLSYAGWAAPAGSYSYNANNELLTTNDASYDYDANGNTISRTEGSSVVNFIYDIDNRLIRVEDGSSNVIAQYAYDPFGRRLSKNVDSTTTFFFYADEGLIGEYTSDGTQIMAYGYKPGSTWTTDPLFMKQGATHYYYQNDHLGTPQQITTASADIVWSATYSTFGKATVDITSSLTNNLRFPGQYYDEETGMHYNYQRFYEPETARYISLDYIGLKGGKNHLYVYARNNPFGFIDPVALFPSKCPTSEPNIQGLKGWCRDTWFTSILHTGQSCYRSSGSPSRHCCYIDGWNVDDHIDEHNPTKGDGGACKLDMPECMEHIKKDVVPNLCSF